MTRKPTLPRNATPEATVTLTGRQKVRSPNQTDLSRRGPVSHRLVLPA